MKLIKLAAAALNQTPLDWNGNQANILEAIRQARIQQASILCCPELCITGYGCEDAFQAAGVHETALEILAEIIPATEGLAVCVGLPLYFGGGLFNVAAVISDGQLIGFAAKQNLAGDGLHYEPRWFKAWPPGKVAEFQWGDESYPLGDLIFQCGDVRLGFEICEDAWVGNRPGNALARRGADVLLNPSASHFAFGKHHVRQRFVLEGSRALNVSYVYANMLGNEAGRTIYDGDTMIASVGEMLVSGPRFSYQDCVVSSALIDLQKTRLARERQDSYSPQLDDQDGVVYCDLDYPDVPPNVTTCEVQPWESSAQLKEEEFTRAVALGLFDYMRKSRSHGFVISLSGGADSAAVATLAALMLHFAQQDIGFDGLQIRLNNALAGLAVKDVPDCIAALVWCIYQGTRNSSDVTREAAECVARSIGATFHTLDVDSFVNDYTHSVSAVLGRDLQWDTDDLALQNIQARVRAPGVWMLANVRNALLLATSNRSEAAVGYTTMDGDTCGGIAPIAGIDKAFLRQWLRWMETEGPQGLFPIEGLKQVNVQQPTAELRPAAEMQTDESDLMPYDVLDLIERLAIRDKMMPVEILCQIAEHPVVQAHGASQEELIVWIKRFFRLWSRNQWKRERFAPSFHVDDENLDPRTWCRFPILSGGFERELEKLGDP